MKSEQEILEFLDIIKKQREWFDKYHETATDYDIMHDKHIKTMPLSLMPILDEDIIHSLVDWKQVRKENPKLSKSSEDESLADGCVSVKISFGQYIAVDDISPKSKRGKWYIFEDQDCIVYKQDHDDADKYFIDAFTSWLMND